MTKLTAQDFASFSVDAEDFGIAHPAIQATNYKPGNLKEEVGLCLAESSFELLDDNALNSISELSEISTAIFDQEGTETPIMVLNKNVRFIPLGIPSIFIMDKEENTILPRDKKLNLKGSDLITITRLPMVLVGPNGIVCDDYGNPQIFTLKLKSSKTMLVTGNRKDKEFKSLRDVQKGLQKHYGLKPRQSCVHLASLSIVAKPTLFSNGQDSSLGVLFTLNGGAKEISKEQAEVVSKLRGSEEVVNLLKDPFGIESSAATSPDDDHQEPDATETFNGEIAF